MADALKAEERDAIAKLRDTYVQMREELSKCIVGQDAVLDQLITCLFAGGHCLLLGVPGLAKTLMVRSIAEIMNLSFNRVQFTPDLMPSDITGTEVLTQEAGRRKRFFKFLPGPIFANIVLADEINRTPPKTQAALMEAMEELQVTIGGKEYPLERPFYVLATQNPIEQEGTYPLPAAQLDRFMLMVYVDYPEMGEEYEILRLTTTRYEAHLDPLLTREKIVELMDLVLRVEVPEEVARYAVELGRLTRPREVGAPEFAKEYLAWGAGPRAPQALILAGKARAMLHGRVRVEAEDIRALAHPVMRHRLITNFHADAENISSDHIIAHILDFVPAPDRPASVAGGRG
ncbi:MAG: AAA family ATPase [Candidatus Omnitrophota bacterium]|nr:MAG: AAA family ATPase [Candidatus Omnitrophota bacterium]